MKPCIGMDFTLLQLALGSYNDHSDGYHLNYYIALGRASWVWLVGMGELSVADRMGQGWAWLYDRTSKQCFYPNSF